MLDLSLWLQWRARAPCEIWQVPWSWLHQPRRNSGNHAIHPHFLKQRGRSQMWCKAIQNYSEWSWEMIEHKLISPQVAITKWVHHQLFYLLSIQYVAENFRLQFKGAVCFYATRRLSKPLLTMFSFLNWHLFIVFHPFFLLLLFLLSSWNVSGLAVGTILSALN